MPRTLARESASLPPITPALIRDALSYLPADCSNDDWVEAAMAVKSGLGDEGFDLWDEWSQKAENYNSKVARAKWRGIRAEGGVKVGTLFWRAAKFGFVLPAQQPAQSAVQVAQAKADHERAARERAKRDAAEAEEYRRRADKAAGVARDMWAAALVEGVSPYLQRKGVSGHGVRYLTDGTVLVPFCDAAGALQSLQRIFPNKGADGSDKRNLPGGRVSGMWHMLGSADGAEVVLLGEGYATCATLHEATGHPVAMCINGGNLVNVARELRRLHPTALLLICGDDDRETEARLGKNPGRLAAAKAARSVNADGAPAGTVFPQDLPAGAKDFNDLAAHLGLDAVRVQLQAALARPEIPKPRRRSSEPAEQAPEAAVATAAEAAPKPNPARPPRQAQPDPAERGADARGPEDDGQPADGFMTEDGWLWRYRRDSGSGSGGGWRRVCPALTVAGLARDVHDEGAALLVEFDTAIKRGRRLLIPLRHLAESGVEYRRALLDLGFKVPTDPERRRWLTEYLESRDFEKLQRVRLVDRVGWFGSVYVLPDESMGDSPDERVMFYSPAGVHANFRLADTTLSDWKEALAALCVGNSRLAFAVACAFAGQLARFVPGVCGGFHYMGPTSIGKTTGLLIAASVWGKGSENDLTGYLQKWRTTSTGLEYQGEQHNDATLLLDEIGQAEAAEFGKIVYMLADGVGKTRGAAGGGLRARPAWRLIFMSSGELTPEQHMQSAGQTMRGGQEVRLVSIPAEVSEGTSLETLHGFADGHAFSGWVKNHATKHYGVAGRRWLEWLTADGQLAEVERQVHERIAEFEGEHVPEGSASAVRRAARRFALVAAAGELATEQGLTGWPAGESTRAAAACLHAWVATRPGGAGNSEEVVMLRQVQSFLEKNGDLLFSSKHRLLDDHRPATPLRAGFKVMVSHDGTPLKFTSADAYLERADGGTPSESRRDALTDFLILPGAWRSDICKGFDPVTVARVLRARGHLKVSNDGKSLTRKERLPGMGGAVNVYHVRSSIFEEDLG